MSLNLNPSTTLGFPRPLTTHVKRALTLSNPNQQPVAFKVKTTAPKLYCVRPNSGRVEPGETVEVQVVLQAMKEEPPLGAKCKDKFLIQSTVITPEKETLPLQDIWSGETPEDAIHSQKVRVAYLPPEGQTVPEEEEHHGNQSDFPVQSGITTFGTAPTHVRQNGHQAPPPIPDFAQQHDDSLEHQTDAEVHDAPSSPPPAVPAVPHQEPVEEPTPEPAVVHVNVHTPAAPAPAPPPVPAPAPVAADPNPELVAKLNDAQAEIERLRRLISSMPAPSTVAASTAPTELRRRTRALSDDGSSLGPETDVGSYVEEGVVPAEGVPLQVVIIIALGVFITTYLFF